MGVDLADTIVKIWNRIIGKLGRKKDAIKKGKKRKNVCKKPKNRAKNKAKETGSSNSL